MLFDSHSHAHFNAFKDDSEEVIRRALEAGVQMMLVGTHYGTSEKGVMVAEKFDGVWAAIGLHPTHVTAGYFDPKEDGEEHAPGGGFMRRAENYDIHKYRALAQSSTKVVAIGEIGLDYYRLEGTSAEQADIKAKQQDIFRQQLMLATELDLAVAIHCREAHDDVYKMLMEVKTKCPNLRGVIHCFTGTVNEAERYIEFGFLISWSGIITFAREWDEWIKQTPLENFLVETDCPYLTPVPQRGKRNEPAYVTYTAAHLGALKNLDPEVVAAVTTSNAKKLFKIK